MGAILTARSRANVANGSYIARLTGGNPETNNKILEIMVAYVHHYVYKGNTEAQSDSSGVGFAFSPA